MSDRAREHFEELLRKYNAGVATDEEVAFIESFYQMLDERDEYIAEDNEHTFADLKGQMKRNIDEQIDRPKQLRPAGIKVRKMVARYMAAAAAVVLVAMVGVYFFTRQPVRDQEQLVATKIVPGSNRALLKLANGKVIDLTTAHNGVISNGGNIRISKTASGQLVYTVSAGDTTGAAGGAIGQNTISTPKGGQYQIILPDGTKAMLNAASSLTYPVAFKGNERLVQLSGEAYFEVAHNKQMPFRVKSADQTVTVLGTHFNINAYADESAVKTTLLEGAVSISAGAGHELLAPGQQGIVSVGGGKIDKQAVDVEKEVAWKNGVFSFDGDNLGTVMRQVARWYDVTVQFDKGIANNKFYGEISRTSSLDDVIKILQLSNVKFAVKGRTITVTEAE